MYAFWLLVIIFFFYSVVGYVVEVTACTIEYKKFSLSRGYLIGPYIPVFGFGGVIMVYFLSKYQNDILSLFINSMFYCCLLEYFTSLVLEKIFKLRWWDYSTKRFNINGRVCLENGILFGVAGVILVRFFHPMLLSVLYSFPNSVIYILGIIFLVILLSDFCLSTFTISKLKIDTKKYMNMDSTEIIRGELMKSLQKYRFFYKRIFKAFPSIKFNNNIVKLRGFYDEQKKLKIKKSN